MCYWVGSVFWILVGAGVAINACMLGLGGLHQPGPGFIFFVSAVLLDVTGCLVSLMTLIKSLKIGQEQ